MTARPAPDGKADTGAAGRPAEPRYRLEVIGEFDRAAAETLMLEIERVGKRYGLTLRGRVERAPDPHGGWSA